MTVQLIKVLAVRRKEEVQKKNAAAENEKNDSQNIRFEEWDPKKNKAGDQREMRGCDIFRRDCSSLQHQHL